MKDVPELTFEKDKNGAICIGKAILVPKKSQKGTKDFAKISVANHIAVSIVKSFVLEKAKLSEVDMTKEQKAQYTPYKMELAILPYKNYEKLLKLARKGREYAKVRKNSKSNKQTKNSRELLEKPPKDKAESDKSKKDKK